MLFLLSTPFLSIWSSFSHGLAMWGSGRIRYFWNWILRPCELNRLASWPQYDWTLTRDWKESFPARFVRWKCQIQDSFKTASETVIDDGKERRSERWNCVLLKERVERLYSFRNGVAKIRLCKCWQLISVQLLGNQKYNCSGALHSKLRFYPCFWILILSVVF